eukprot:2002369-Alexandrium_andersonii.AAC.1
MSTNFVDSAGRKRVSGGALLNESQTYPSGFGRAVADVFLRHRRELHVQARAARVRAASSSAASFTLESWDFEAGWGA